MASQPTQLSEAANRRAHLKEVTNETVPDSLGAELRAARQKLGVEIKNASTVTKIKPEYLEALEEGRLEALPGRTYAIGFLRTYAGYLQLDSAEMVARLKGDYPAEKAAEIAPGASLPEAQPEMRIPQGVLIIVGIIIIAMIYAGVYLFRSANEYMEQRAHPAVQTPVQPVGPAPDSSAAPSEVPQPLAPIGSPVDAAPKVEGGIVNGTATPGGSTNEAVAPGNAPAATASVAKPPQLPAPKPATASGQTDAHKPAITSAASRQSPNSQPAASSVPDNSVPASPVAGASDTTSTPTSAVNTGESYEHAIAAAPATFGVSAKDSRVMLRATDTVFLRIETDGPRDQVLFEGTLNKGEVYHVPSGQGVILTTRNGGAVDVYVDGASKGPAGPAGIALKGLPLDPGALQPH